MNKFNLYTPFSSMCFFILPFLICMSWVSISTNGGDMQALLSIKDHIHHDPTRILESWNNSYHLCDWTGVSCGPKHGRVVGLNLPGFKLNGNLSTSIGNLTFLRDLNLEDNALYGSIPQEISKLKHLQILMLRNNSFTGEIPKNLSYLLDLTIINLDRNKLTGMIPSEIGSLPKLFRLSISRNDLSGTIPPSIGNLSALQELFLFENSLTGIIPAEIGSLPKLSELILSQNHLSGTIPPSIENMSALQFLFLDENNLTGALPMLQLQNITTLVVIDVSFNNLSGSMSRDFGSYFPNLFTYSVQNNQLTGHIPASITNASKLEYFDLSFNHFYGHVPTDLGQYLSVLNSLDFSNNNISSNRRVGLEFLTSLTNCTELTLLHLYSNSLEGMLPKTIANFSNILQSLRLDGNNIYGVIPDGLEGLTNLGRLGLSQNSLTGTIPDSIGKLTKLQQLWLSNNGFSGGIPSTISNLTQLSNLKMDGNMLSGALPASLSKCTRLVFLDLSHNKLTDVIPRTISDLSSLTYLNLSHNNLSGILHVEVGKMIMLTSFDVSDNNLSGVLPSTLGSLSLEILNAQNNFFNDTIPRSLAQIRGIQRLDLSNNKLIGRIPVEFTNFTFIQFLNLSFNCLEGEVPSQGVFKHSTSFSIVGNQKLCGGITSLRLPHCPKLTPGKLKFSMVMVFPAFVVVAFISIAYACFFYNRSRRERSIREPMNSPLGEQYPKLSYSQLLQATDRFSPDNLIGTGRYSWVYKGILTHYEQGIAIKVIKLNQRGAKKSFFVECEAIKSLRHRNLVKIITACSGTDFKGNEFKALVYAFMSNGNLDSWLHPISTESTGLELIQRLNIAIDVGSALAYLHLSCEIPIIHRDIKPSNILLDDDFCAHLGDFGSARSLLNPFDKTALGRVHNVVNEIEGTVGYIALEYAVGAPATTLVDVYSYGVVLLEMFSGKRPTDSMFKDDFSLHNYVKMVIPDQVMSIADPRLFAERENNPFRISGDAIRLNAGEIEKCLASVFRVGVICSAHAPKDRMEITDAVLILDKVRDALLKLL